ncbi:hypothetical protein BsWGS_22724 [Bradybaena similaris]
MSTPIKRGLLSWALTALQVSPENKNSDKDDLNPHTQFVNVNSEVSLDADNKENAQPSFSRKEIADHCSSQSCWMVINNKVYDVTRFLRMHPGGEDIMLEYGGHDATSAFIDKGHSRDGYEMLSEYCIGRVVKADWFPEKNFT